MPTCLYGWFQHKINALQEAQKTNNIMQEEKNQKPITDSAEVADRRTWLSRSVQLGLAAPTLGALLVGCRNEDAGTASGEDQKRYTISFVGAVLNNPFWDQIHKGAKSAAQDFADVDLTYFAPEEFSHANVNELIKSAISAKPDGLAIDYRGRAFEATTQYALDEGIAVQFYNNFKGADSSDARIVRHARTAVGLDKYLAALRSAEPFLSQMTPGEPVAMFNGVPDSPEHLDIQNAYLRVLSDAGWSRDQIEVFPVTLDPAENYQLIKTYLANRTDTAGIICWDSVTGSAAARAKVDAGLEVPVMAWNLDRTIVKAIKDGTLNQTLTQQPFLQGYYAVLGLYLKIKYGVIDLPLVDPATLIVNRDNIADVEQLYRLGIAG